MSMPKKSNIREYKRLYNLNSLYEDIKNQATEELIKNAQDVVEDVKDEIKVEDKRPSKVVNKNKPEQRIDYFLQPKETDIKPREENADDAYEVVSDYPNATRYSNNTTPSVSFDIENEEDNIDADAGPEVSRDSIEINLYFKDRDTHSAQGNATTTKYDETFWGYCISLVQHNRIDELPKDENDLDNIILGNLYIGNGTLGEKDSSFNEGKPIKKNFTGYTNGSIKFCNEYMQMGDSYYIFRDDICINLTGDNRDLNGKKNSLHSLIKAYRGDGWNPSDIYICRAQEYDEIRSNLEKILKSKNDSNDEINSYLLSNLWIEGTHKIKFAGLSMKQMGKKQTPVIEEKNIDKKGEEIKKQELGGEFHIIKIYIPQMTLYPEKGKPDRDGISYYVENDKGIYQITYRNFTGLSYSSDVTAKGSKAHFGKIDKDAILKQVLYEENGIPEKTEAKAAINSWFNDTTVAQMESFIKDIMEYNLPLNNEISIERFHNLNNEIHSWEKLTAKRSKEEEKTFKRIIGWPRVIDYLHILKPEKIDSLMRTFIIYAQKEGEGSAPHLKIQGI